MSSQAHRHELLKFDIQKFRVESCFQVPVAFLDDNKYHIFETSDSIHLLHRSGVLSTVRKTTQQCQVTEHRGLQLQQNECFSKIHYLRDQKTLILYERNSDRFYIADFSDEEVLATRVVPRLKDAKTVKVKFAQSYLLLQTPKKISVHLLPQMTLIAEAQIKARYFELTTKRLRLISYDYENNTVTVSQGHGMDLKAVAALHHPNFRKIDGLFVNSEPHARLCFFSMTEKLSNKIYVLSFDEKPAAALLSYLYTFNLDYFNITRLLFKPRHNLAVCLDKANRELRIYRTLNIYENRNFILTKTVSELTVEQSFPVVAPAPADAKPTFRFDATTRLICQQGIYGLDLIDQSVKPIYKFENGQIRRFLAFDFAPKVLTPDFECYAFTYETDGVANTHILILSGKKEKIFHDDKSLSVQILAVNAEARTVELLLLLDDRKSFRWVRVSYHGQTQSYKAKTMRIIFEERPHSGIHNFFASADRREVCIVTRKPEEFEVSRAKYDPSCEQLLTGEPTRRPAGGGHQSQRLRQVHYLPEVALRDRVVQQTAVPQLRNQRRGKGVWLRRQPQTAGRL